MRTHSTPFLMSSSTSKLFIHRCMYCMSSNKVRLYDGVCYVCCILFRMDVYTSAECYIGEQSAETVTPINAGLQIVCTMLLCHLKENDLYRLSCAAFTLQIVYHDS